MNSDSDIEEEVNNLNESPHFNITEIALEKYNKMVFNPLRFDCNSTTKKYNDVVNDNDDIHECSYLTPEQFCLDSNASCGKFSFLNVNIRSLSKKLEKLKECIKTLSKDFSIIGLSETHLKEKPNDVYNLSGYNIEYMNRVGREKGGVCMYVSDKINYKLRKDLCHANSNYESCFIEIECHNAKNIVVGVIYRAHTSIDNFIGDIDPVFKKLNDEKKQIYIMGDFNIDLLKVDDHRPTHDYLVLIFSYSLLPTIYKPTRITETTATIIDNILTNDENVIKSSILVTDITDHMPTVLTTRNNLTNHSGSTKKITYKRIHTDDNIAKFKQRLIDVKWQEILDNNNANDDYNKFIETFDTLYNECVPLKKCTNNRRKEPMSPWITKGLLKSINKKNKLYKQYLHSPSNKGLQQFKTYKNKSNMLIRKAKRKYSFLKFEQSKNNMKQTWNTINNILGRGKKQSAHNKFKDDIGNVFINPEEISNQFNDFFVNVGPKLASNIQSTGKSYFEYLKNPINSSMYMKPIVEMDITKIIEKFNPNKSAGDDNIGNSIIKRVAKEIVNLSHRYLICQYQLEVFLKSLE